MSAQSTKQTADSEWKNRMAGIITSLAILIFVVLEVFLGILLWQTNTSMAEVEWARFVYLLTGVETITFAGIGWLFGREVHREQAQVAERQADEAMGLVTKAMQQNEDNMHGVMGQVTETMKQNTDIMEKAMGQVAESRKESMELIHQTMDMLSRPTTEARNFHAFIHKATTIINNSTEINSPYTNNKPDAILIVTPNWNPGTQGIYDEYPIGVWYSYSAGRWYIYNQGKDRETALKNSMPSDAAFNVLVIDG